MPLKQSFCVGCFTKDGVDFTVACATAARLGFAGVEWWFRDDQFTQQVAIAHRYNLEVASICGHYSLEQGLCNVANHASIEAQLHESIDLAVFNRIPNLICFSGNRLPGQSDTQALEVCATGLRRVIAHAEKSGIMLNMELLNSKRDHVGYQCDHTAWGVALCQKVASPNFKLLYDIYHMQIMEGDVIATIKQNIQWIGHFHTAGNPGRNDLDGTQELNYAAISRAIRDSGYHGFVAHEFTPKGEPLKALEQAFKICNDE